MGAWVAESIRCNSDEVRVDKAANPVQPVLRFWWEFASVKPHQGDLSWLVQTIVVPFGVPSHEDHVIEALKELSRVSGKIKVGWISDQERGNEDIASFIQQPAFSWEANRKF